MPSGGSLSLADVAERTPDLAAACNRCDRAGRYRMSRLIEQHGASCSVPDLLRLLSADCPKRKSVSVGAGVDP